MNKDIFRGKWKEFKGKVKQQWSKLTDDDLDRIKGDVDEMVGKIQSRYGFKKDEAKREVEEFLRKNRDNP